MALPHWTMVYDSESPDSRAPQAFVVEVFSELKQQTIQQRWRDINAILRLSMLAGVPMQLDATLSLLCDFGAEIAPYNSALVYFWDEAKDEVKLHATRGEAQIREHLRQGNIFNFWAAKYGRPLLVTRSHNLQADALLRAMRAESALVVPLLVSNRALGSLQLFSISPAAFSAEDAQLLWILTLLTETFLTRQYANEGLLALAFTDFLTGLKTRGYFEQQLELEVARSERKKNCFSLLMIDIDFFKHLNDRYGHHVGDQVLRDVSSVLMKDMREVDTVARYGGEEFVIILPETSGPGALQVAQRLRKSVEQARFFAGSPHAAEKLTISIGVGVFDTDAQFKRDLIEAADAALYDAKSNGRNQVVLYSDLVRRQRKQVS